MKAFKKIQTDDLNQQKLQDNIAEAFSRLLSVEILDGVFLEDVSLLSSKTNQIAHGLGRAARGYFVAKKSAQATVWDLESANTKSNLFLNLKTSANCSVSLWVF